MSSSQFNCPNCRTILNKPPQLEMLSEIKQAGGSFVAFGDPDSMLTCPACGFQIRVGDIIDGKYDPSIGWSGAIALIVILGIVVLLYFKCSG